MENRYEGNRYVKHFTCWNQLAVLMFGQLSNRESLRDVVLATQAHAFEEFAYRVVAEAQRRRTTEIFKLGGKVYAFDSTTRSAVSCTGTITLPLPLIA